MPRIQGTSTHHIGGSKDKSQVNRALQNPPTPGAHRHDTHHTGVPKDQDQETQTPSDSPLSGAHEPSTTVPRTWVRQLRPHQTPLFLDLMDLASIARRLA